MRAALCAALLAGCAAPEETWDAGPAPEPNTIAILYTGVPMQPDAESILRAAFPDATHLRIEQLVTAGPRLRQDGVVLVVPDLRALTSAHWSQLTNHIRRGGPALFWGLDPATGADDAETLAMLRPLREYYTVLAREIRGTAGGMSQSSEPMRFQSPFPRETAVGPRDKNRRWIPLAEAREPEGHARGWPASLLIEAPADGPLRAWGWIGWAPSAAHAQAQRALLRRAARSLRARQFILTAGIDRAVLGPGDPIEMSLRIVAASPTAGPWRITVEMENEAGVVTRRLAESLDPVRRAVAGVSTSLFIGVAPRAIARAEDMRLRFSLADAAGAVRLDGFTQRIRLLPDEPPADDSSDERLGVRGAGFIIGRRPLTLFGATFAPLFAGPPGNPLDFDRYDIETALRELDLIREAGLHVVEMDYISPAQAPQLRHALDEMRARRLWALLRMPSLSPWTPDWERADALFAALRLPRAHRLFAVAVDLTLSPDDARTQAAIRGAWRDWIAEQYGDSTRAEALLGAPPDSVLPTPAAAREADAPIALRLAIARFLHDRIGRHLRDTRRFLDGRARGALLTALGGDDYPLPPPAHHLDFVTCTWPASAHVPEAGFLEFRTAHARGLAGGKPVLWRHAGAPLAYPPSAEDARQQAEALEAAAHALRRASAAGFIYASLSGGPRGATGADVGLLHPDTRRRPGGDAMREHVHQWRRRPPPTPVWRGREADLDFDTAWRRWGARYADDARAGIVEELRPIGWGRSAADLPAVGLGDAPFEAPAPFAHVNAEWIEPSPESEPLRRPARRPIRLEWINTGVAAWGPSVTGRTGSVWVRARSQGGRSQLLPVRETAPGARASLMWTPTDPDVWTLRGWLHPFGEFGEPLRFEVQ
jgi:hypothetical protein